jgi:hypothetical protein
VRKAAAEIPKELSTRFDTAEKLSDEDSNTIIKIAAAALSAFQPAPPAEGKS